MVWCNGKTIDPDTRNTSFLIHLLGSYPKIKFSCDPVVIPQYYWSEQFWLIPSFILAIESYFIRKKTTMLRKQSNTIYYVLLLTSIFLFRFLLFNHVYIFFLLCSTSSSKRIFLLSDSSTNDDGFQFDPCSKNSLQRETGFVLPFLFGLLDKFSLSSHELIAWQ